MPTSSNGDERGPNVYAQLMRATARDDPKAVKELLDQARTEGTLDDNLLRLGLQNCAKKGLAAAAQVLLENGAKTDTTEGGRGSPALFWAVAQPQNPRHIQVARLLLESQNKYAGCPADKNWKDEQGRSLINAAAWRGHIPALQLLLERGADVNSRDLERRTVLHNLAADKKKSAAGEKHDRSSDKKGKWDHRVVAMILERPIDVNARDDRKRTALHWACATGKTKFVEQLISRPSRLGKVDLNMPASRGKTALQLACSTEPVPEIVELLLNAGADAEIRSDGGWTCLHVSATIQNSIEIVELLLSKCPSLLNAQTSTGLTALHCAAEAGNEAVVKLLLSKPKIKLNVKDAFYTTPLLRAAQQGHTPIVEQLAPFNNIDRLSHYAIDAANHFEATVVDFRSSNSDHQNIVRKRSVFEVLYAKDALGDHDVTTRVDKLKSKSKSGGLTKPRFRWIHLPANNLAWVEALISKAFIENDCSDLEGFKAVERAFSHQHRGPKSHSQYMTPLCQRSARGALTFDKLPLYGAMEDAIKDSSGRTRHDYQSSPERPGRSLPRGTRTRGGSRGSGGGTSNRAWDPYENVEVPSVHAQMTATGALRSLTEEPEHFISLEATTTNGDLEDTTAGSTPPPPSKPSKHSRRGRRVRMPESGRPSEEEKTDTSSGTTLRQAPTMSPRTASFAASDMSAKSDTSKTGKGSALNGSNIVYFSPFLHWETEDRYRRQCEAIREAKAEQGSSPTRRPRCHDETLIRAHLESSLHLRRTLDQFFLHGIDTEDRDSDQVVFRFCRENNKVEKLYMVDQLWMWILGPGLIITAFPQRWQQPKNDPLNVLDGIIEDVNSKTGAAVLSVYDLALLITSRTSGAFDRHRPGDDDYQFLDMFESSIGNVNHEETQLYRDFYQASAAVHDWISEHKDESVVTYKYPQAVDRFLDIGKETALLQEIKDIRDELNMISMVLHHQKSTLPSLSDAVCEDMMESSRNNAKVRDVRRRVDEQKRTVDLHLNELDRMARLSEGIEGSLLNLLDLKQKQSNAFEARFARVQAAGTVRQGQIIMVFTMVTILFLPMSFIAAFFAIPFEEFSVNGSHPNLPIAYVAKYLFSIGLGISVVLIALAFSINPISALTRNVRAKKKRKREQQEQQLQQQLVVQSQNHPYGSVSKHADLFRTGRFSLDSTRKSLEIEEKELAPKSMRSRASVSLSLRRAVRGTGDVEHGRQKHMLA